MIGMINCTRFRPIEGQTEAFFKAFTKYVKVLPF